MQRAWWHFIHQSHLLFNTNLVEYCLVAVISKARREQNDGSEGRDRSADDGNDRPVRQLGLLKATESTETCQNSKRGNVGGVGGCGCVWGRGGRGGCSQHNRGIANTWACNQKEKPFFLFFFLNLALAQICVVISAAGRENINSRAAEPPRDWAVPSATVRNWMAAGCDRSVQGSASPEINTWHCQRFECRGKTRCLGNTQVLHLQRGTEFCWGWGRFWPWHHELSADCNPSPCSDLLKFLPSQSSHFITMKQSTWRNASRLLDHVGGIYEWHHTVKTTNRTC